MKKIPAPIRIWSIKDAPKRYRALLKDTLIGNEDAADIKWIAVLRGEWAKTAFWSDYCNVAWKGDLVRCFDEKVFFFKVSLGEEDIYFFTNTQEDNGGF